MDIIDLVKIDELVESYSGDRDLLKLYLYYLTAFAEDFLKDKGVYDLVDSITIEPYRDEEGGWRALYVLVRFKESADVNLVNTLWKEYMEKVRDSLAVKVVKDMDEEILRFVYVVFRVGGK